MYDISACHLSAYQKHGQQHKPQEITTTRPWITFKTQYGKSFSLSQSYVYVQTQRRERKEGKPVIQTNSKVMFHIIMSLWVVFGLSALDFKKLINQSFSKNIFPLKQYIILNISFV